jgi:hypothetical protein
MEQLRESFEKFMDSPYSKKRPSPHPHKVATRSNEASFKTTVTQNVTMFRGMKITPLLRYPYHYNLA